MTPRELDEALAMLQDQLVDLADQSDAPLTTAKLVKLIAEIHLIRATLYA